MFSMSGCPKFQSCNASVCPVDLEWNKRSTHEADPTCFYLSEAVKDGSQAQFEGAGLRELYGVIHRQAPEIKTCHPRIKRALERAALTGSRMTRRLMKEGRDNG